jgi:hypothetical protein
VEEKEVQPKQEEDKEEEEEKEEEDDGNIIEPILDGRNVRTLFAIVVKV